MDSNYWLSLIYSPRLNLLCLLFLCFISIINGITCPEGCVGCALGTLSCEKGGISIIPRPDNLRGSDISKITLRHQKFLTPILYQHNFSLYAPPSFDIREVLLLDCNIQLLLSFCFTPLKLLKILDLSSNEIQSIESSAFYGLQLKVLRLDGNRGLQLNRQAFDGLSVESLSIRDCELKTLDSNTFLPIQNQLRNLYLNNNQLRQIPYSLRPLFKSLIKLDLLQNPLNCSCGLHWIADLFQSTNSFSDSYGKKEAACWSNGTKEWISLKDLQLTCGPPIITAVQLDLMDQDLLRLVCIARGSGQVKMRLIPANVNVSSASTDVTVPIPLQLHDNSNDEYRLTMNISRLSLASRGWDWDKFTCFVGDYFGNSSYVVRIRWPPWLSDINRTSADFTSSSSSSIQNEESPDNISSPSPPYTPFHLIIAVLITFCLTVLLFCAIQRFLCHDQQITNHLLCCCCRGCCSSSSSASSWHRNYSSATRTGECHPVYDVPCHQVRPLYQPTSPPPTHPPPPPTITLPPSSLFCATSPTHDHIVMNNNFDIYSLALEQQSSQLQHQSYPHPSLTLNMRDYKPTRSHQHHPLPPL